jgi:acetoacetate decarboxylase
MGSVRRLIDMMAFGGFIYRDAHYFVADVEIDARAARRWVPWPLRIAEPARASIFTAWFPQTTFGSVYREAGILLHVRHWTKRAVYSPWMIVDDDVALILGRELLGYPKKLGEVDFDVEGDAIRGIARRRGTELVRMRGRLGATVADPPPMLARPHRNVRASLGLAIPTIVAFTPRERVVETRKVEDVELTVSGSERDPLSDLGFGAVRSAFLHRVDLAGTIPPLPVGIASPIGFVRQMLGRVW